MRKFVRRRRMDNYVLKPCQSTDGGQLVRGSSAGRPIIVKGQFTDVSSIQGDTQ